MDSETTTWVVSETFALEVNDAEFEGLADDLEAHMDASVARVPGGRLLVTYSVQAASVATAPLEARELLGKFVHTDPVGVAVASEADYVADAQTTTLPRLVSAPEVAEMLGGLSRQRVHQLRSLPAFPAPLYDLRTGPVWDARAIEKFERGWTRKPGRPCSARREF